MVAEVAGGGEVGRLAVLVAAVARDGRGRGESGIEPRPILGVQREAEHLQIVVTVLALAESRADDGRRNSLMLQHPARRHVGERDAVLAPYFGRGGENALEAPPAAGNVDEALVF